MAAALPLAVPALERLGSLDGLLVNQVVRVDCQRWADGRLVLLGDAAHAMAPKLGQGANSAIVDAAVLAAELAAARPLPEALGRYTARRRPAVGWVQDAADRLARLSGCPIRPCAGAVIWPCGALAGWPPAPAASSACSRKTPSGCMRPSRPCSGSKGHRP